MIGLIDLIKLAGVELDDYKIHLATSPTSSPREEFFNGTFREWQHRQNKKNFQCEHVLSLIHLGGARWLFAGVFEVLGVEDGTWKASECYLYSTREVEGLDHLTGRAVVEFDRKFRASYLRGEKFGERLLVAEIQRQRMTIGEFPGCNSILLSHAMLKTVVREATPSWKTALSNVAGVYVMTDTTTGKHYVGSAYGGDGIWQRWTAYAKTGHGGNKELRALLRTNGKEHAHHFQFSLLEVCDLNSSNEYVIGRETHWKDVLRSREFGLNEN